MSPYSLSTSILTGLSRDQALAKVVQCGFRQIELASSAGELDNWEAEPDRMRRALDANGLRAATVHVPTPQWTVASNDEAQWTASVEAATACFGRAAEVGAEIVICHGTNPHGPFLPGQYEANQQRTRRFVAILAERARAAGVRIALENLPRRGEARPGATAGQVLELIDGLGDHVGVCIDTGHCNINGRDPASEVREAAGKLIALHLADNDGQGADQHLIPGRGAIDWQAFLAALEAIYYQGIRTFELVRPGDEDFDAALSEVAQLRGRWEAR